VKAALGAFGEVHVEGERYARDVVIEGGRVSRRRKGPSRALTLLIAALAGDVGYVFGSILPTRLGANAVGG
jgi:hypothetical protein